MEWAWQTSLLWKMGLCQTHCVNLNSLYDFILPFVKKKTELHLYPYVFVFIFFVVKFALGAKFYCNVQSIFW